MRKIHGSKRLRNAGMEELQRSYEQVIETNLRAIGSSEGRKVIKQMSPRVLKTLMLEHYDEIISVVAYMIRAAEKMKAKYGRIVRDKNVRSRGWRNVASADQDIAELKKWAVNPDYPFPAISFSALACLVGVGESPRAGRKPKQEERAANPQLRNCLETLHAEGRSITYVRRHIGRNLERYGFPGDFNPRSAGFRRVLDLASDELNLKFPDQQIRRKKSAPK